MTDPSAESPPVAGRGRWVAILTGAISILIGVLYLALIVVLDSRGPLQPPPPEALVDSAVIRPEAGAASSAASSAAVPPPA
ncbi:MAG: hypothetical protein FJ062_00225 [Cyanobacteria bacterium M_DeepCast_100m_m1_067]|jgi:hypothetical protein|nr:hypothetical protein [Cyanobacteria bacterium M_DeepCast_100m_m1_067]